jgi:hypothetical protein
MGIDLGQPLTLATDQVIVFDQLQIGGGANNSLNARIVFSILDGSGNFVTNFIVLVTKDSWNSFWPSITHPNTAQIIYQMALDFKKSVVPIPANISNDFVNTINMSVAKSQTSQIIKS